MEFYPSIDHANKHVLLDLIKPILADLDLLNLETGMHPVNDDLYFNVIQYESTTEDQRVWESHRREYDVHYIISGEERIYHNFLDQMSLGNYDTESDWQEMTGQEASELVLLPGNVLIFDKEDAHKTGLKVTDSVMIKKIVFKIAM
ncbi:YhcH/YjgK/YiaL family protein [Streptococcus pluranimalium]|uniref:YhcH/YjgK/YiaL family protein n=1 Tax=Streptococcus pluranimalium TaxID=82348 RepID=UPI0024154DCB|nr:YhcH/YjgK/YiaL family protein [Streptococcus pluranimalium]WFM80070.1 YhcH/YjgK/YiaL family protein [Streptococcus pluranimalium]